MVPPDRLLARVTRPARYTGGEWNSIRKNWDAARVRVALIYPDIYEIGMSNLGLPILYDLLNSQPHILAERAYAPWGDMEQALREANLPLFSLESRRPLRDFDILGFSLGYELTYTNVLNMLDLAHIPVLSSERGEQDPLIIAGGSCVLNPEPMADFIDLFVIGEGEEVALELLEIFAEWKKAGGKREEFLKQAALLPGIYLPRFYQVEYHPDGTIASFQPTVPEAKVPIVRRFAAKLPPTVTRPVMPYLQIVHDRGAVEIQRGCTRGCRFCQAGVIYRPLRHRERAEIIAAVGELVHSCGYDEISLVSLSTSDYPGIEAVVQELTERYRDDHLTLSLPSLRLDTFSVALADSLLRGRGKTGLTFAPEAGTERLRRVINKTLSEEDFFQTIETAFQKGWTSLKLYYMLGLPTETLEDVKAIVEQVRRVRSLGGGRMQVRVSAPTFIPKPHTPFQWLPQEGEESLKAKQEALRRGLRRAGATLSWPDPLASELEAVLSRGDRRLGPAIFQAWKRGCKFDAWSESFNYEAWRAAFAESGIHPDFYARRHRSLEEVLPWGHLDIGVSPAFLKKEYQRTLQGGESPDCRTGPCSVCGLQRWFPECRERARESHPS